MPSWSFRPVTGGCLAWPAIQEWTIILAPRAVNGYDWRQPIATRDRCLDGFIDTTTQF